MKRSLLHLVIALCTATLAYADESVRSLQETLKHQGLYYGAVTGQKSAETTAAIRRYQIRQGLQITGELNEETLHSLRSSTHSVAAVSGASSTAAQPNSVRPDVSAALNGTSHSSLFNAPDRSLRTIPSYAASFYQSVPVRVNRRAIAAAQYQLMRRGYYRGRIDANNGRQTALALRAFQSTTGLPATGRLDMETLNALGVSDADPADFVPATRPNDSWFLARKFEHGKWQVKWKRDDHPLGRDDGDQERQANREPGWDPYNQD